MTEEFFFTKVCWDELESPMTGMYKCKTTRNSKKKRKIKKGGTNLPSILTRSKVFSSMYNNKTTKTGGRRGISGFQFSEFAKKSCNSIMKSQLIQPRSQTLQNEFKEIKKKRNKNDKDEQKDVFNADEWVDNIKYGELLEFLIINYFPPFFLLF